ncbi:MAG TPA: TonB-dependent receptor [Kofleriaceae bacterium]|nr:TonB-dependent receptor [Kofleriaceae bacterium]
MLLALAAPAAAWAQPLGSEPETPATPDATVAGERVSDRVTGRVTGRVIDALGVPVGGAHVGVEGAAAEATTGDDGRFQIDAPDGATLVIERAGYDVALASVAGGAVDDVVMMAAGKNAETIEIQGEAPAAAPGAAKLDRGELQRIPGAGGDVVRALTAMPGVVNLQVPLGYNGVVIRGASPQDSKVLIDGFEVPLLFHNVGFRAVLPAEAIESLDYVPGGFDVAFGRASSGIVNLVTRPGGAARTTQAEISLIDGGLLAQGALGTRTRYMLGLRRSTIDLVLPSLIPDSADLSLTTVPRYYDGQLRIDHELSARWQLTLSALGSDDLLALVASKDAGAVAKRLENHTRYARATAAARYHDGPWAADLALSALVPELEATSGLYQHIRFSYPMVSPRAEVTHTTAAAAGLTDVVWRAGADAQVTRVDLAVAVGQEPREGEPPPAMDPRDTTTTFRGVIWAPDAAAWVNSERAPIHHQLDLRIDYSWAWGPAALTAFVDVQNVYLNESVVTYFYSYDFSQRAAFKSLPLVPSLGLRGVL